MITEKCKGCGKIGEGDICLVYPNREANQWTRLGGCAMATHTKAAVAEEKKKMGWKRSRQS